MNAKGVKLRDEDAVGVNWYNECTSEDGDGGGSNCPKDFTCPSEELKNRMVRARSTGWMIQVRLGWVS